jgi:hypothetical protein
VPRTRPRTMRGHAGQGPGWQSSMHSCLCPHDSCLPHESPAEACPERLHSEIAHAEKSCCKVGAMLLQAILDDRLRMLWYMHATCMPHHMNVLEATSWAGARPACHSSTGTGRAPLLQGIRSGIWGSTMPLHAPCKTPSCHQLSKLCKAYKVHQQSKLHLLAVVSALTAASLTC